MTVILTILASIAAAILFVLLILRVAFKVGGMWITGLLVLCVVVIGSLYWGSIYNLASSWFERSSIWMILLGISIAAGIVLFIFRRRRGLEVLRGIAISMLILAGAALVINILTPNSDSRVIADGCAGDPFTRNYEISEKKMFVLLGAGEKYTLLLPTKRGRDFRISFADTPLEGQPSFDPGPVSEYVDVAYYGDASGLANGLSVDTVRIQTNRETYRTRVNDRCLGYYVYLARR